jgi:hypothetical protein
MMRTSAPCSNCTDWSIFCYGISLVSQDNSWYCTVQHRTVVTYVVLTARYGLCTRYRLESTAIIETTQALGQIRHQLDATLCRFYFCRLTLHVSGVKRPSSGVLKNFVPNMVMWWPTCNYNTCTRGRRASFLILLMMSASRPKHVEWLCRNKTCTVLHQVGVSFDLYYDARKHKRKTQSLFKINISKLSF